MRNIDKKELTGFLIICGLLVFLPVFLAPRVPGDAGMAVGMLCFYVIVPAVSAAVGIYAGLSPKRRWYGPIIPAVLFLGAVIMCFEWWGEPAFLLFAAAYLGMATAVFFLTWLIIWLISLLHRKWKGID